MATPEAVLAVNSRYQVLAALGSGSMGTVYRTLDRLTGQTVALKQVLARGQNIYNEEYSSLLAQEFRFLASLRHPHIISVLDYGIDGQGQPFYTMPLLEGAQELIAFAEGRDQSGKIDLLLQVLQALAYLHRRGILHRDLKPANVLVDAHEQVKLVDFGLAVEVDQESDSAGTLSYMAPEVLTGKPSVPQSDLYAVGVIAYQLFAGDLPFKASTPTALIFKVLRDSPKLDTMPPELTEVIGKLLAVPIEARYATAEQAIDAICSATGRPLLHETYATRESFLQASRFIGREAEMALLVDALKRAATGQGSAWLIGGESGVGKSRLLEELQTQALLEGALVLRGQAIAEGGLPFQLWREAIRRLSLQTEMTDFEASVLKPLIPDLSRLLGHEVADTPEVDIQSMQARLLSVIESMFGQQHQLIVLLLEDLHWANEGLILLKRLSDLAQGLPLLIIGTYRHDERPRLPDDLPMLKLIKLERLSDSAIEMLSVSMLGEVGKSPPLIQLLKRETEGNVFFIVEVVRALAEEAGQLADIGRKTLPHHVFANGMQTVIQRRLDKVSEAARRLLTLAAVVGRELDLKLLAGLMPGLDLDLWLQQVATVIEVQDNRYRFAHDKLRETILNGLTAEERRQSHREVALALETTYPNVPEQYAALAYHWNQAQDAAKTIQFATLAGQEALRSGSYHVAIQFFEQALALTDQVQLDRRQQSSLYSLLGDAEWGQSDMHKSHEAHVKALRLLGYGVPDAPGGLLLGTLKPLIRHGWRHLLHIQDYSPQREEMITAAESLHQITMGSYHDANLMLGLYAIFNGMDASERAGSDAQAARLQARFYSSLAFAMGDVSMHALARPYRRLTERYLKAHNDPEMLAWYDFPYGLYLAGRGRWEEAIPLLEEASRLSKAAGSVSLWVNINLFIMRVLNLQNRYAEALTRLDQVSQVVYRDNHTQSIALLHITKAALLFIQGKTSEAQHEYFDHERAIATSMSEGEQTVSKLSLYGFLVTLYRHDEAWDKALQSAEELDHLLNKAQTISFVLGSEAAASIGLYLTLWERDNNDSYRQKADKMLALYHRKYTRHYEIGQPVEYTYRCWYDRLKGDIQQAKKNGDLAIQAAQTYQMPYYEAAAHDQLGRCLPKDDPERAVHLEAALRLFQQIGAEGEAEQILKIDAPTEATSPPQSPSPNSERGKRASGEPG